MTDAGIQLQSIPLRRLPVDHAERDLESAPTSSPSTSLFTRGFGRNAEGVPSTVDQRRRPSIDLANLSYLSEMDLAESAESELRKQVFSMTSVSKVPRFLDREGNFKQSLGRLQIRRVNTSSTFSLRLADPFHTLVNTGTAKLVLRCAIIFIVSWVIFAFMFLATSRRCKSGADTFIKAVFLAIETIQSMGYGVPDSYFNSCPSGLIVLGCAALWESLLNALLISIVFTRVSRPSKRTTSICFSEKAVITKIRGQWYFMFQVCDFRKHQLCEAQCRLYGVQHRAASQGGEVRFQTRPMRLNHPDDELGGMLLLALPQLVVHQIDPWSPLCPATTQQCEGSTHATSFQHFPQIFQRAEDLDNGNREVGPQHVRTPTPTCTQISRHVMASKVEVLCLVEGVDTSTSSTLQARHSYTCDDIVFHAYFDRCVDQADDGMVEVNFDMFHSLIELNEDDDEGNEFSYSP